MNKNVGYSSIEVIIALSLVSILLAISVPRISPRRSAARELALEIEGIIERSKALAVYSQKTLQLSILDNPITLKEDNETLLQYRTNNSEDVVSNQDIIYFSPKGTVTPNRIEIENESVVCRLTTSLFGRIRTSCEGRT